MTGVLHNELPAISALVSAYTGSSSDQVPLPEKQFIDTVCDALMLAWQRAAFSNATEESLLRYFTFHFEGISRNVDTLCFYCSGKNSMAGNNNDFLLLHGALLDLLDYLLRYHCSSLHGNLVIPGSFFNRWASRNEDKVKTLLKNLQKSALSAELQSCLINYIALFGPAERASQYSLRSLVYFDKLTGDLLLMDWRASDAEMRLNTLLQKMNFNFLQYFGYWQRTVKNSLKQRHSPDRLSYLRARHLETSSIFGQSRFIYDPDWPSLKCMKENYLKGKMDHERQDQFGEQSRSITDGKKMTLNLSVSQIGCLLRLLFEENIFGTKNLQEVFRFFCLHFSSVKQQNMSVGSLSKESYSVTQKTAGTLRGTLAKIVVRINRTFFPD